MKYANSNHQRFVYHKLISYRYKSGNELVEQREFGNVASSPPN